MRLFTADRGGRPGSIPLGLLGSLLLIVGVEVLIASYPMTTLSGVQWEYRRAREMASGGVNDCSILAFGDSMLKLGLAPEAIRAATGQRAYNFAITATQPPAAYSLLKRALDHGARPSAVLLESFPNLLANDLTHNVDHWPILLDLREAYEISGKRGDWDFFASLLLKTSLPSLRSRQTIRRHVARRFGDQPNIEYEGTVIALRNWAENRGFQSNPCPGPPKDLLIWQHGYFRSRAIHPVNRQYIERFLDLADEHKIAVFWLLPPYQPILQAACEDSGFDRFHETFVRRLVDRHPGLRVIDGRHAEYDPKVFLDPHHFYHPGALVYSAGVGEVLRRFHEAPATLTSPWVELPRYQALQEPPRVESLDESRAVVLKAGLLRR